MNNPTNADRSIEFVFHDETWVLEFRAEGHSYWLGRYGGRRERIPGASTIASVGYSSLDALMKWAVNEHKEGRDFTASRDLAAACGQAAHDQLEALATTGQPLTLIDQPERVRGALQAVAQWHLDYSPKFIASEVIVCSPHLRVAGRFDFLCEIDGELAMGDLKSSGETTWQRWHKSKGLRAFCQMGGYRVLRRDMFPKEPEPTSSYVLRVGSDATWDFKKDPAPEASEDLFLRRLAAYRGEGEYRKAAREALRQAA